MTYFGLLIRGLFSLSKVEPYFSLGFLKYSSEHGLTNKLLKLLGNYVKQSTKA